MVVLAPSNLKLRKTLTHPSMNRRDSSHAQLSQRELERAFQAFIPHFLAHQRRTREHQRLANTQSVRIDESAVVLSRTRSHDERPWCPRLDICDDPSSDRLTAYVELPGVRKEDIRLEIRGNALAISGERKAPTSFGHVLDRSATSLHLQAHSQAQIEPQGMDADTDPGARTRAQIDKTDEMDEDEESTQIIEPSGNHQGSLAPAGSLLFSNPSNAASSFTGASNPAQIQNHPSQSLGAGIQGVVTYPLRELRYGRFARNIKLPAGVEAMGESIAASMLDGILTISWPRAGLRLPQRIDIA